MIFFSVGPSRPREHAPRAPPASPETPRSICRMALAPGSVMKKFISSAAASLSAEVSAIDSSIEGFRYWPGLPPSWFGIIVMLISSGISFW